MKRLLLLNGLLLAAVITMANTIVVKNIDELNTANKKAQPGDIIILQNGEWKDVTIKLSCSGTKEQPITFKAAQAGKVLITGNSQLRLGGDFIIVDGLYFTNGYAGKNAVINFCIDKDKLANNCRVTNISVNDFNNPKRMDENYWVSFYGKNNRLDHCSFKDKKNMGVLLAVILDDERSRENFHSIDHNYFGRRPALASNSGEIMRVGVSQHCQFNSNTQITDNYFEECDGETEIVSIKSGSNVVRGNVFKECQGGVVLRHGDNNTVENNIFLGNNKQGTGGVRIINKGQWVVNNFFYECRGFDFRSPLSLMNGIPNSPANRYVQVTDAVVANNTFYNCSSASFCEGSDTERTLPPANVLLVNNIFYNNKDTKIYNAFDDISGISFWGNEINTGVKQATEKGFIKASFKMEKQNAVVLPVTLTKGAVALQDSLQRAANGRLNHSLSTKPGFADLQLIKKLQTNAYLATGATWFKQYNTTKNIPAVVVNCATAEDIYAQLGRKEDVIIQLTGTAYTLDKPFVITKKVAITGKGKTPVHITTGNMLGVFVIGGNGNLSLQNITVDGKNIAAKHFICNDTTGSSNHYNLQLKNTAISNLNRSKGCQSIFYAYKSMIADSIVIRNNTFTDNGCDGFIMADEKDDKGYYSAEKIVISNNNFSSLSGNLLNVYRGGNDESTMGPNVLFSNNKVFNAVTAGNNPLIYFMGAQVTNITGNTFTDCNAGGVLVQYADKVRARHNFEKNTLLNSGRLEKNQFVTEK